MFPGAVEHELRVGAEDELIDRELAAHPDETIPEIAVRVATLTDHGTARGRLSRVLRLVMVRTGLKDWNPEEHEGWLDQAEHLAAEGIE